MFNYFILKDLTEYLTTKRFVRVWFYVNESPKACIDLSKSNFGKVVQKLSEINTNYEVRDFTLIRRGTSDSPNFELEYRLY